ncbi:MAG: chemotaxis protein CheB [Mariprofundus sp.]|nr:chemotaxis protein CheB [Mariprofundus sp.]
MRPDTNCALVCADQQLAIMLSGCIEQAGHRSAWRCDSIQEATRQLAGKGGAADILVLDTRLCENTLSEDVQAILKQGSMTILLCVSSADRNNHEIFSALANGAMNVLHLDRSADDVMQKKVVRTLRNCGKRLPRMIDKPGYERRRLGRRGENNSKTTLVVIGASTGGPSAIVEVLSQIRYRTDVAIVLVQHLDAIFSGSMTNWMDKKVSWPVGQAQDGGALHAGEVILVSGDDHWILDSFIKVRKTSEDHGFFMPSIDAFMFSLIANWHQPAFGVLLTGMGKDGSVGLAAMQKKEWTTFAQDEQSSAVYGMPQAAARLGAADQIMSPAMIGKEIDIMLQRSVET